MVCSPLAGGLLSGKFRRDFAGPQDARRTRFDFPPVEREHAYNVVDASTAYRWRGWRSLGCSIRKAS